MCNMVGYLFMYLLRVDISMAIVCMVKAPSQNASLFLPRNASWENSSSSLEELMENKGECGELETRTVEHHVSI